MGESYLVAIERIQCARCLIHTLELDKGKVSLQLNLCWVGDVGLIGRNWSRVIASEKEPCTLSMRP